jgi:exo-beta-1,3-glucanase (GH17 family)
MRFLSSLLLGVILTLGANGYSFNESGYAAENSVVSGFSGFVYVIDGCRDMSQVNRDFSNIKNLHNGRLAITFGGCDQAGYWDGLISAAGNAGIKLIPLVWFGYDGGDAWKNRAKVITQAVIKNPSPVYAVAIGDEPLYDWAAGDPQTLANAIWDMKNSFKNAGLSMPVSISEMAYGFQQSGNPKVVFDAIDMGMINTFPYFAQDAVEGGNANSWNDFVNDISYFQKNLNGKPILVTQTGWPSNADVWKPNNPNAVVSIASEQHYFELLESKCDWFKQSNIGWMARTYDDFGLPGWGIRYENGGAKFNFKPSC